jgi:hypothetical protein
LRFAVYAASALAVFLFEHPQGSTRVTEATVIRSRLRSAAEEEHFHPKENDAMALGNPRRPLRTADITAAWRITSSPAMGAVGLAVAIG